MDESNFQQPTPQQLHLFVQGDPIAMDTIIQLVLPQLYEWGQRHYPQVPDPDVKTVIHDVLSETCRHHARYNPGKTLFTTYVIGLIVKRMSTTQRKQMRQAQHERNEDNFSEKSPELVYNESEVDIIRRIDREEFFQHARQHLSEMEEAFLDLMLDGEIHQEPFIAVLARAGMGNTSREVNRTKERLRYNLQRIAQTRGLRLEDLL